MEIQVIALLAGDMGGLCRRIYPQLVTSAQVIMAFSGYILPWREPVLPGEVLLSF
ncbi:hypothetical protein GGI1_07789 [Acidithiobacillus sp. GGI-221]|nr:hypothetical protein GGI1_07789 [Acidithiobacillus sp. GGI-221]